VAAIATDRVVPVRRSAALAIGGQVALMRDIDTIDSDLRLIATLRNAARERAGPPPSITVADALLDERHELIGWFQRMVGHWGRTDFDAPYRTVGRIY
jgi:hypothetical protein